MSEERKDVREEGLEVTSRSEPSSDSETVGVERSGAGTIERQGRDAQRRATAYGRARGQL